MKLLIVVVCYRVVDLTIDCLRSLNDEMARLDHANIDAKAIVCENGTGGDAEETLAKAIAANGWQGWCQLQAVWPNLGFTGGNNHVIRAALASEDKPEYMLLLNADTLVLPGAIVNLLEFMDSHPKVGIAGSQLESRDGKIQCSPYRFHGIINQLDVGLKLGPVSRLLRRWSLIIPTPTRASEAPWVSGASMMIRRAVFDAIGLLDEGYYTYFDDIDLCLNAKRAGWPSWFVPESRIVHLEGASTGITPRIVRKRRPKYWFDARRRYFLKNHGRIYAAMVDLAFLSGFALRRFRYALTGKPDNEPLHMLSDSIRYSVFVQGFRVPVVENPALAEAQKAGAPAAL